jgi:RNA polymerase sigma-70 factor (ECF subfamily)
VSAEADAAGRPGAVVGVGGAERHAPKSGPPAEAVELPSDAVDPAWQGAVARAQAGDEPAFALLYRRIHPRLLRYLRVLAGSDAEDIAAEAWLQVCRDLDRFTGTEDGFQAWVIRIGRNRAADHFRSAARRPSDPVPVERLAPIPGPHDTEHQALSFISTEQAISLIASLPTDQAEAVMLRAVIGMDATMAGKVLGKRAGAVRTSAHRGLRTLAARLAAVEGA